MNNTLGSLKSFIPFLPDHESAETFQKNRPLTHQSVRKTYQISKNPKASSLGDL
jgi:hypothetical protein